MQLHVSNGYVYLQGLSHAVAALLDNVSGTILPIVKFLQVIPKGSILVLFSINHIIRNRSGG